MTLLLRSLACGQSLRSSLYFYNPAFYSWCFELSFFIFLLTFGRFALSLHLGFLPWTLDYPKGGKGHTKDTFILDSSFARLFGSFVSGYITEPPGLALDYTKISDGPLMFDPLLRTISRTILLLVDLDTLMDSSRTPLDFFAYYDTRTFDRLHSKLPQFDLRPVGFFFSPRLSTAPSSPQPTAFFYPRLSLCRPPYHQD